MIDREALGKYGAETITNSNSATAKNYCAITMLEDTIFATLTTSNWVAGSSGSTTAGLVFPKGLTIFGAFTAVTLTSGKVICYKGATI
jgi:hypothetical protein